MEPEARARFDEIWAILREVAERQRAAEIRMDRAEQRLDRAEQRMDRAEQRMEKSDRKWDQRMKDSDRKWDQRMKDSDQRMEKSDQKWDKRFEATRKLVEAGIGIVSRLGKRQADLERAHKAFVDSFRKGNTNGRKRG